MADDQNRSNKPPMNGGFGASEIEKIGASAYTISKAEQEQRQRASTARTQMQAISDLPEDYVLGNKVLTRVAQTAPNTLMSAEQRIRSSVSSRLERSNMQAANVIGREYSSTAVNSLVRQGYDDPIFQNRAMTMMNMPYGDLAQRREDIGGQINSLGSASMQAAGGLFTNRGPRQDLANQISGNASQANNLVRELSSIDLAMKTRRQSGADPLSRFEKLNSTGKSAEDFLTAKTIGEEINKGGVNINQGGRAVQVSNSDIGSALAQEAQNLRKALSDLANSAGKSAEDLDKMRKSAEESADNFEKLQRAAGAGGGGGGASGAQWASAAGGMFNAVGNGIQQIAVAQRLGQVGNIGGYAGIENQKYDMYKSGRGGDVLNQMLSSQWSGAEGFGRSIKTGQQLAVGAYTAGGVAQTAAGGFQVAEGMAGKTVGVGGQLLGTGGLSTQEALQGMQNVAQGASITATNSFDLARGVSTNAAGQQGIQASMAARREILKISAEQMQGFRDFGVGMSTAAMGMGKRSGAFLDEATSSANIQNMANARMSPEQMAQMSQLGVSSMGSQFNTGQAFAARGLERSGMGSMGENMQRMAALAGAGSNNPQTGLQSVLEVAFAKGLDSSKALTVVAESTAAMAKGTAGAALGIDTTAASAAMVAMGINRANPNQEMAAQRGAVAADLSNRFGTNTDVSFAGMVNTARLSKNLNISGTEAIQLQMIDKATLLTQQGKSVKEQSDFLLNKGIDAQGKRATEVISGALSFKDNSILEAGGVGFATGLDVQSVLAKKRAGKPLSRQETLSLGATAVLSNYSGAEELGSQVGTGAPNTAAKGAAAAAMTGEGGSNSLKTWDNLRTSGFKQLSEQALEATKTMEKFGGALKVLVDMNEKLEKFGGAGGEGKFSDAAAVSAETFGKSTIQFENSVNIFDKAIRDTMGRAGLSARDLAGEAEARKLVQQGQNAYDMKASAPSR